MTEPDTIDGPGRDEAAPVDTSPVLVMVDEPESAQEPLAGIVSATSDTAIDAAIAEGTPVDQHPEPVEA
jgi:hypothetical protein